MYGIKKDWDLEPLPRCLVMEDYQAAEPRWCAGCGDFAVLTALQRLARDKQLAPEKTVFVSGIGCSSRLPHYMKTYGFHGLHGRPLPVASGIRARRPDLDIFVITGDGDCCAIGTAHWIHAIRYNMKMTVLLLDNNIYGLTKMQTSPTTPKGHYSNTQTTGAYLSPINPLTVTLGITNRSFVAQTVDWYPAHVYDTLKAAHEHPGLAFVRILQRCPHFMPGEFDAIQQDATKILALEHPDGIPIDDGLARVLTERKEHDPRNLGSALEVAGREDVLPIGLFYRDLEAERYDDFAAAGLGMSAKEKVAGAQRAMDRFLI